MDCSVGALKELKNKKAREVATSPLHPLYTPKVAYINFGVWGRVLNVINHVKLQLDRCRGFGAPNGRKSLSPTDWRYRPYNSATLWSRRLHVHIASPTITCRAQVTCYCETNYSCVFLDGFCTASWSFCRFVLTVRFLDSFDTSRLFAARHASQRKSTSVRETDLGGWPLRMLDVRCFFRSRGDSLLF